MPDGIWRSSQRGVFRGGDVLTPLVLWALEGLPRTLRPRGPIQRGREWLIQLTDGLREEREPWHALRYPIFTASYAVKLCAAADDTRRMEYWADLLAAFQIGDGGGGWSDANTPPRPLAGAEVPDMWKPNLSATSCALEGMQASGRQAVCRRALGFVHTCQNFAAKSTSSNAWDDGGFFFTPDDPIRNKAGAAGIDAKGNLRFQSYGSATCDGLLCLLDCGVPVSDGRVVAALGWLQRRSHENAHPGDWPEDRADTGRSLEFYYAHVFAEVLRRISASSPEHRAWCRASMTDLASSLQQRQAADGSWANDEPESLEDDPILATALALRALAACDLSLRESAL